MLTTVNNLCSVLCVTLSLSFALFSFGHKCFDFAKPFVHPTNAPFVCQEFHSMVQILCWCKFTRKLSICVATWWMEKEPKQWMVTYSMKGAPRRSYCAVCVV